MKLSWTGTRWGRVSGCGLRGRRGLRGSALVGMFRMGGETGELRECMMKAAGGEWSQQVQFRLGWLPLTASRLALAFTDVEDEVKDVVGSVHGVEVGVYQRQGGAEAGRVLSFKEADRAMERRGWYRMVGVMNDGECVGVYVPAHARLERDLGLCVVVLNRDELVVAAARCDPRPAVALAMQEGGMRVKGQGIDRLFAAGWNRAGR